ARPYRARRSIGCGGGSRPESRGGKPSLLRMKKRTKRGHFGQSKDRSASGERPALVGETIATVRLFMSVVTGTRCHAKLGGGSLVLPRHANPEAHRIAMRPWIEIVADEEEREPESRAEVLLEPRQAADAGRPECVSQHDGRRAEVLHLEAGDRNGVHADQVEEMVAA